MLNVEDMINNGIPDELSVMAYVPSYYQALAGAHKVETASNRFFKVIRVTVHTQIKMWIQRQKRAYITEIQLNDVSIAYKVDWATDHL